MKRPFLEIYWRSEAFLEIAKPLMELEDLVETLPEESLVIQLYQTLQTVLCGKREWSFYRQRMKLLKGADEIARRSVKEIQRDWQYVKGGQGLVWSYLKAYCPEDVETTTPEELKEKIRDDREFAENILEYASILKASYAPLFRFRDSLFGNVKVYDPHYLLLDEVGETDLDPIHLLRFLEFESEGDRVELKSRPDEPYQLSFSLQVEDLEAFRNLYLCRLFAFKDCSIARMQGGSMRPTELPKVLREAIHNTLIPGVIVAEGSKNSWAIARLKKQGLECHPIFVSSYTSHSPEQYLFFPSLSGILALTAAGVALKCPDEESWVV
jgi:CRISPR-associated endonuclease/helicase Cas3